MLNIRISECTDGKEKVIEISDKDVAAAFAGSPAPARIERGSLVKYLDGNPVPDDAENWNIVFDPATGLMWPAEDIAVPNWAASEKACADLRTGGFDDWRWPSIQDASLDRGLHAHRSGAEYEVLPRAWIGLALDQHAVRGQSVLARVERHSPRRQRGHLRPGRQRSRARVPRGQSVIGSW